MSDVLSKYANFVDLLLRKTKESRVPWSFDSIRSTASVWNGDVLLNLSRGEDQNFEDLYTLTLFNRSGDVLESFNDETISGVRVPDGDENYFIKMRDLHNLAMRQATGADKALDDFIDALESDRLDGIF